MRDYGNATDEVAPTPNKGVDHIEQSLRNLSDCCGQAEELADRICGPSPEVAGSSPPSKLSAIPTSVAAIMHAHADGMHNYTVRIRQALNRIASDI